MKFEDFVQASARANDETRRRYIRDAWRFKSWLGSRRLDQEAVNEYETKLQKECAQNSLASSRLNGVNLYLKWRGTDLKIRRPPKKIDPNPKLVSLAEYDALLARVEDPEERLVVRLLHDTFWSPSDVVAIRLEDIDTTDGITSLRRLRKKTGAFADAMLTKETADELGAFLKAKQVTEYVFRGESSKPHRHRTWPNAVLRKHRAEGVTPRAFRRTGATNWGADLKSLMVQGGWSDPKTILAHYRRDDRARHLREFEAAVGRAKDPDPVDDALVGYR